MKYVRKGAQIVVDRGLTDDSDLLDRLEIDLRMEGYEFTATRGRNRALLPKTTLVFQTPVAAHGAEVWIDNHFEA